MKKVGIKRHLINIYERLYEITLVPRIRKRYRLRIMDADKTIKYIIKHNCSVSRYGEGEFNIMFWTSKITFQNQNEALAEKMRETLKNTNSNLLLCMPRTMISDSGYNDTAKKWWREWSKYKQSKIVPEIISRTGKNYVFGDALLTRPYMDFRSAGKAKRMFSKIKRLWEGRRILIVEGEMTRLGVGNDLFAGASDIKRILAPAENAFDSYENILSSIKKHYNGELILIALGPTATVLSADLANENCQAIDIGHIDIEYEWFLSGSKEKTAIKGKYTNEVEDGRDADVCLDQTYLDQVIDRIF